MLLARFFKVHPGYLVDDPEGYHTELTSDLRAIEDTLDLWLISGAERFARDPKFSHALLQLAKHDDSRKCLVLMGAILETPELVERLAEVLMPGPERGPARSAPQAGGRRCAMTGRSFIWCVSGGSYAERAVVHRRKLAPAALSRACSAWRSCASAARGRTCEYTAWRRARCFRPQRGDAVHQFRHHHGVSGMVWWIGLSADAVFDAGW